MSDHKRKITPAPAPTAPEPIVAPLPPVVLTPAGTEVTGWRKWVAFVLSHLTSWPEVYIGLPLAVGGMFLLVAFSHSLLGRKPLDEGYDFVGLGFRFLTCIFLVLIISLAKQSQLLGTWLTKEEQLILLKTHWSEGVFQKVKAIVFFLTFAFILLH